MPIKNNKLINNIDDLKNICQRHSAENKKIVMTNGCFDIIHSGHTHILQEAKNLGDILIVAINSDASIKRIKTEARPIVNETDRAYILSCLSSTDYIYIFNEDTPENLICQILPDILVKGSDYKGQKIAGEDCLLENNRKVMLLDLIPDKSSTSIINKILNT
tara:strand:+ start:2262 stop:2747 length:486 start_codon:yes stop_codon:yes gene_type:complete